MRWPDAAIYEASFFEDGGLDSVGILERRRGGAVLSSRHLNLFALQEHGPQSNVAADTYGRRDR
jgi:hypothetical protein